MEEIKIGDKRIMHIDTSSKLYEKSDTGIAFKITKTNENKGLCLSNRLKRDLDRDINADQDYPRIYSICIYFIIKEDLDKFDILVICGDEDFTYVKQYLDLLMQDNKEYLQKKIISISELKKLTGNRKISSYAHGAANSYRKRALYPWKRNKGIPLTLIDINYDLIVEKWLFIEKSLGKNIKVESDLSNHLPAEAVDNLHP